MALPITVPFTFANATTTQNLSSLDADFATVYNAVNGIGNGTVSLSNVNVTGGNISNVTFSGVVASPENGYQRNRIINGAMVIDQRNAGASVSTSTGTGAYTVDRWQITYDQVSKYTAQQNAGSVTPPTGYTNYIGITSSSAYTVGAAEQFCLRQFIEGFNTADLAWGTASAQTVTLSFWVRSSLTGTFGGSLSGYSNTNSYPFTYSINNANTWEYKTITVAGPTTGTWNTSNSGGIGVVFGLAVGSTLSGTAGAWSTSRYWSATGATSVLGTNGATFYITGVQFEVGTVATPFERRQYGQELMLCQRYYFKQTSATLRVYLDSTTSNDRWFSFSFPSTMRATPTLTATVSSGTFSDYGTSNTNFGAKIALASTTATSDISAITASSEL